MARKKKQDDDEFKGHGGTYLLDPETGRRTRIVAPTAPPGTEPQPPTTPAHDESETNAEVNDNVAAE